MGDKNTFFSFRKKYIMFFFMVGGGSDQKGEIFFFLKASLIHSIYFVSVSVKLNC